VIPIENNRASVHQFKLKNSIYEPLYKICGYYSCNLPVISNRLIQHTESISVREIPLSRSLTKEDFLSHLLNRGVDNTGNFRFSSVANRIYIIILSIVLSYSPTNPFGEETYFRNWCWTNWFSKIMFSLLWYWREYHAYRRS
jgi:hypothetical protein